MKSGTLLTRLNDFQLKCVGGDVGSERNLRIGAMS